MSITIRNHIPLLIVAILGFFIILSYPFNVPMFTQTTGMIGTWIILITSFALGLGAINLLIIHGRRITRMEKETTPYSIVLIGCMVFVFLLGMIRGVKHEQYTYVYDILVGAGSLTLTSLRGFFMFTAFYRAYRARTWEGTIMLLGSVLVMSYQIPFQPLIHPSFPLLTEWFLDVPFVAGNRGIALMGGIGLVLMTFRMLSGIDRSWLGAEE